MDSVTVLVIAMFVYMIGAIADMLTTNHGLDNVKGFYEKNPVLRWLIEKIGLKPALAVKTVVPILMAIPIAMFSYYAAAAFFIPVGLYWTYLGWRNYQLIRQLTGKQ